MDKDYYALFAAHHRRLIDSIDARRELVRILAVHDKKEELILYPVINKSFSSAERKALLDQMS